MQDIRTQEERRQEEHIPTNRRGGRGRVRRDRVRSLGLVAVMLAVTCAYGCRSSGDKPSLGGCSVKAWRGEVTVSAEQAGNAATIAAVAVRRGLSERAAIIAIATAMQESRLRNLEYGDRDSLGLFQQRPSMGWGRPKQILDPVYASGKFYDELLRYPGFESLPLTVAAQRVQRSATPRAYAKHETPASLLAAALTGSRSAAISCRIRTRGYEREAMRPSGLTTRGETVHRKLRAAFGGLSLGGFAPGGGVSAGHMTGSAHYEGRAIDVSFRPATRRNKQNGWAVAQWAVVSARALGITEVIYDGRIWTSARSRQGWRRYRPPQGGRGNRVLMHRDHIHITIARGTR